MKRQLLLLLPALVLALPVAANPSLPEANHGLIAQRGYDWEEEEEKKKGPRPEDISIKEIDPRNGLIFNQIIPAKTGSEDDFIYYDKDYRGQGCVLSCDKFDGLVVKWSTFYLQIQPYEKKCLYICHTSFPMPSKDIKIYANDEEFRVAMVDDFEYIYYLPLEVREAIKNASSFTIQVAGVGLSTYAPSEKSIADIKRVIDDNEELSVHLNKSNKSTKDRLIEAKQLLEDGLISEEEYAEMRNQVLGLDN